MDDTRRVADGGDDAPDVVTEQANEILGLLRQAAAEVELSRTNVATFLGEAESLVRGLAGLTNEAPK